VTIGYNDRSRVTSVADDAPATRTYRTYGYDNNGNLSKTISTSME